MFNLVCYDAQIAEPYHHARECGRLRHSSFDGGAWRLVRDLQVCVMLVLDWLARPTETSNDDLGSQKNDISTAPFRWDVHILQTA